jgi:glycosyltransferase involved in cell wall biosynthesis
MKLSVVIPSYKDPLLQPTIDSLLRNSQLGDQLEVIPVMDGYYQSLKDDPRVVVVYSGKNRGMRESINTGVKVARGEFIMRLDEHCCFGPGYDKILTDQCKPNWILTAKRYFLDPKRWKIMDIPPVITEKLVIQKNIKFAGMRWPSRDEEYKDSNLIESMAMQGSMWITPRKWFNEVIKELETEGYGPAYQDSHEAIFKTWKAGGKFYVTKDTWFAHKHRSFSRTHQEGTKENPWIREKSWTYCLKVWKDYYEKEVKPKWKI